MAGEVKRKKLVTNEDRIAFLNAKTEELSVVQEEELIIDYDEALKEYQEQNKPHKIKFKGEVFDIPHSMPFSFGLFYMRYCIKKQDGKTIFTIPDEKLGEFIEKMFGKNFLDKLEMSDDVELNFVLGKLIPDIMSRWGYKVTSPKNK